MIYYMSNKLDDIDFWESILNNIIRLNILKNPNNNFLNKTS